MTFDLRKENADDIKASDEPQKIAQPKSESSDADSELQRKKIVSSPPKKPDVVSSHSMEQANSSPEPSTPGNVDQSKKGPPVPSITPVGHAKPLTDPKHATKNMQPASGPSLSGMVKQNQTGAVVASKTPADPVKANPAEKSSTKSLMRVMLPAEKSQTKADAAGTQKDNKKIIAVGGAKGGVGKSMLAANLAVGLALLGQKVVLADLDLGGADVHLYAGVKSLLKTWNDFLDKKVDLIRDILTPTAFQGLSLIGGDSSRLGSANLPYSQKLKIIRHLKELQTDFLVVDLGGDTTFNGLDFFLLADQKIVVSGIEPASVLDSYTFVKVAFYRFLERFFSERNSLKDLAEQIRNGSLEKSKNYSLDFIIQEVRSRDQQASVELKKQVDTFRLSIVLNMAESNNDLKIAETMQKLVKDKCFIDIGILGAIPFDKIVRKAARAFTPIVVESPKCQASRNIHKMLAAIILHREQESTRAELLQKTSRIRREAKDKIDSGNMTLDGLTVGQINSVFDNTPKLRQSFRKILNIVTG